MDAVSYQDYVNILKEELVPAMGCTEPIAIAYAAAVLRETLGRPAERMEVEASGNIIKNVKSVFVPGTGGLRGIPAAAAAGMAAGDPSLDLEVLSQIGEAEQARIREYLAHTPITVKLADSPLIFDILVRAWAGEDSALVRIANYHTHIVRIEKNGAVLKDLPVQAAAEEGLTDKSVLSVRGILEFAREADLSDVEETLSRQIRFNTAIAQEGLRGDYGANIGQVLLSAYGDDVKIRAKAMAAAGSDARMNGCGLPVVIVSGSGNQGLTASLPVIEYAKELGTDQETLYRALLVSDLITIHLKAEIGRLSAYCGAVSAGCGSGAGIAYLYGKDKPEEALLKDVSHTIVNSLAVVSGMVCDGAKASCAAKIASAVDAGILGFTMYQQGQQFRGGDGIISKGVEETIHNIGLLATQGMRETDREILDIMTTRC
ncbi:L-serine ammonia-lyase, iron-sulfur-dependent, subunit alpha [Acutalibacter sp. LFL-21]|nr:L-serine ammonia-lyase, iron-sulfur-dependent, subunit alpha [Acutalibacter sp. LFL-21]MCU7653280.1 L-serine ammonia-lyase, iron-sulfur-dependent, subunit alpha [Acutalibacter sp. LFL-21]